MDSKPIPKIKQTYLWLCAEGWMRFGPFEWLWMNDAPKSIIDEEGVCVARHDGHSWILEGSGEEQCFYGEYFIITSSSRRPVIPEDILKGIRGTPLA